jgi:hypothetical protein
MEADLLLSLVLRFDLSPIELADTSQPPDMIAQVLEEAQGA